VDSVTPVLLQQGLAGVAILAEAAVILRLYTDNKQLQKDKDVLQEARRLDAVEVTDKVVPVMNQFSQTAGLLYSKLKSGKES
jgi:hypothetical protein